MKILRAICVAALCTVPLFPQTTLQAPLTVPITNDPTVGTVNGGLAKIVSGKAVSITNSDTQGILGIVSSGGGTSGHANIAVTGMSPCNFDGPTTSGDYVTSSTIAAPGCHDYGPTKPSSVQIVGRLTTTNATSGTYPIIVWTGEQNNGSGTSGGLQPTNNLGDVSNAAIALSNLGGVNAAQAATAAPVQTVAGRTGAISLHMADIGDLTLSGLGGVNAAQAAAAAPVQTVAARAGNVTLGVGDITGLGTSATHPVTDFAATADARFLNATKLNGTDISSFNGVPKFVGGAVTPAAGSDIGGLWGCTGYLKNDGTCGTGTGGSISYPSAGLVASNGSGLTSATSSQVLGLIPAGQYADLTLTSTQSMLGPLVAPRIAGVIRTSGYASMDAAVAAAISAESASGVPQVIEVSPGTTMNLSSVVNLDNTFGDPISIVGYGLYKTSQIKYIGSATTSPMFTYDASGHSEGGLVIEGVRLNANNLAGSCLSIANIYRGHFEDVACENATTSTGGWFEFSSGTSSNYEMTYRHLFAIFNGTGTHWGGTAVMSSGQVSTVTTNYVGTGYTNPTVFVYSARGNGVSGRVQCTTMPTFSLNTTGSGTQNITVNGLTVVNPGAGCTSGVQIQVADLPAAPYAFHFFGKSTDSTVADLTVANVGTVASVFAEGAMTYSHTHCYNVPVCISDSGNNHIEDTELDSVFRDGIQIQAGVGAAEIKNTSTYYNPTVFPGGYPGAGSFYIASSSASRIDIDTGWCGIGFEPSYIAAYMGSNPLVPATDQGVTYSNFQNNNVSLRHIENCGTVGNDVYGPNASVNIIGDIQTSYGMGVTRSSLNSTTGYGHARVQAFPAASTYPTFTSFHSVATQSGDYYQWGVDTGSNTYLPGGVDYHDTIFTDGGLQLGFTTTAITNSTTLTMYPWMVKADATSGSLTLTMPDGTIAETDGRPDNGYLKHIARSDSTAGNIVTIAGAGSQAFVHSGVTSTTLQLTSAGAYDLVFNGATHNWEVWNSDTNNTLTITPSASPVFDFSQGPMSLTLSANTTATSSGTLAAKGHTVPIQICEGSTVYTLAWPSNFSGFPTISIAANACQIYLGTSYDGSQFKFIASGSGGGSSYGTSITTFLNTPTSANLATAMTDETGSGPLVFSVSPALTGSPTAPTQTAGTSNTTLATTAFVATAVSGVSGGSSITSGTAAPSNPCTAGQMYSRTTTGVIYSCQSSIWISNDATTLNVTEDFMGYGTGSSALGEHGWSVGWGGSSPSITINTTPTANHPGITNIATSATSGSGFTLLLPYVYTGSTYFTSEWIEQISSISNVGWRFGLGTNQTTQGPTTGIYFRYDTNKSDTTIKACNTASSTETCSDTGITPVAGSFYDAFIWSPSAGHVSMTIGSVDLSVAQTTAVTICSSGCTITATPATGFTPYTNVFPNSASAVTVGVDYFQLLQGGLTR